MLAKLQNCKITSHVKSNCPWWESITWPQLYRASCSGKRKKEGKKKTNKQTPVRILWQYRVAEIGFVVYLIINHERVVHKLLGRINMLGLCWSSLHRSLESLSAHFPSSDCTLHFQCSWSFLMTTSVASVSFLALLLFYVISQNWSLEHKGVPYWKGRHSTKKILSEI